MTARVGRLGAVAIAFLCVGCGSSGAPLPGGGSSFRYQPYGRVTRATTGAWEWLRNDASLPAACGVQDNRWNELHAAPGPHAERVFVEDLNGTPAFGWQWLWPQGNAVVTYPEVICGTKPWDMGSDAYQPGGAFPFQAGAATLTVSYDVALQSDGVHNLAFSLWAVSDPAAPKATITNEVMIWVDDRGMRPAGSLQGSVEAGGSTFDVWIMPGQTDASGSSSAVWTYAAFVARDRRLAGPLDLTPFLDWLRTHDLPGAPGHRVLAGGAWVGDLELGTEIVGGAGAVEVTSFSFEVGSR